MPTKVSVKINTNQLNRALKTAQRRVERVAVSTIEDLMDEAVTSVSEQFQNAVYDGSTEDIEVYAEQLGPRTWRLVADGEAAGFIEYGTGVGRDAGYINPTTGKPWWVFTAKGRAIKLGAGGKELTKRGYFRTTEDVYNKKYYANIGIGGGRTRLDPNSDESKRRMVKRDGKLFYIVGGSPIFNPQTKSLTYRGGREVPVNVSKEYQGSKKVPPYFVEGASRSGAFISSGNPPNYIMRNASEKMTEELAKRFKAKFK